MHVYTFRGAVGNLLMRIFGLLPLRHVVVFSAFDGKMYGDNPRAIYEEMLSRNLPMKYVWLLRDTNTNVPGARVVKANSIASLYYLSTARLWVDCSRKREWVVKRKGQYYVQTWHGDLCLKKIEGDAEGALPQSYIQAAKHDSEIADLMLSGSRFSTNLMRRAFWYKGEIAETGMPKSDVFFKDKKATRDSVCAYFDISNDTAILLYVPTFRIDSSTNSYIVDYERVCDSARDLFKREVVLLVKMHPKIKEMHDKISYSDRVLDASLFEDTNQLITSCDLLITDYSSCMFDALIAGIPVVLYACDISEYTLDRGMYFSFSDLPFKLTQDENELNTAIKNYNFDRSHSEMIAFKNRMNVWADGESSKRAVDVFAKKMNIG